MAINILRIKTSPFRLDVDGRPIAEHVQDFYRSVTKTKGDWPCRDQMACNVDALTDSIGSDGEYALFGVLLELVGWTPEDIGLGPVKVTTSDDMILWNLRVYNPFQNEWGPENLTFRFHRPQLEKEVKKLRKGER